MTRRSVSGLLAVDFFTHEYRVSGHVSVRSQTVGDLLNDKLQSHLELNDVYISRIIHPAEIVATYAEAQLRKDSLLFAIVPANERLSRAARSTSYFGRRLLRVWMGLPTFEIKGDLEVTGMSVDWETYLAKIIALHIPLLNATARPTISPDVTFEGEA